MANKKIPNVVQTIEITNFGGRLTRLLNGDMNSGFAKFATSWGYDPFSKPMNLTWFEQPVDISGPIKDLVVAAKKFFGGSGVASFANVQQYVLLLGNSGTLYVMQPNSPTTGVANVDSVIGMASITGSSSFNFGGSLEIFAQPSIAGITDTRAIYIGSDTHISTIPLGSILGTQRTVSGNYVGTINNATGAFRPMKIFQGLLRFSNAATIATIGAAGTVVSLYQASIRGVTNANSDLQIPLPVNSEIQDIDISIDGNYLLIATSEVDNEQIAVVGQDSLNAAANDSVLYGWNGSDPNITTETTMPSVSLTALQTYLGNNLFFSEDGFGSSMTDGTNKLLTLPGNKSPWANSTTVNGNFLSWISPEMNSGGNGSYATMYYFGGLDQENPPGLYRVMRIAGAGGGSFTYQTPVNMLIDNHYTNVNSSTLTSSTTLGYGKHYVSALFPNTGASLNKLYRFLINSTGLGSPQLGIYETQTQLFSKRITIKQIRVYTEPTVSGNGFQMDFIGSDGTVISNGTKTYTFASGTDITQLQGSLERIDFNPSMKDTYALAIRLTNTGSTNMTIKKVEIDYAFSGK